MGQERNILGILEQSHPTDRYDVPVGGGVSCQRRFSIVEGAAGSIHVAGGDRQREILEWVKARTDATHARLTGHEVYKSLVTPLDPVVPNKTPARPYPIFRGQHVDVSTRPAFSPRGLWGRLTLDGYINPSGPPSILLDVDALGRSEGVPWTFGGAECLPPAYTRCLVRLSWI